MLLVLCRRCDSAVSLESSKISMCRCTKTGGKAILNGKNVEYHIFGEALAYFELNDAHVFEAFESLETNTTGQENLVCKMLGKKHNKIKYFISSMEMYSEKPNKVRDVGVGEGRPQLPEQVLK